MSKAFDAKEHDEIFLQMRLAKALQRDADGNVIFTVEASNENLDLEKQSVLQSALLGSKDYFLKSGVVSKDHKYRKMNADGTFEIDEDYIIGEPLEVYTEGKSTLVKGKLYAGNEYARKFIKLLDQGSSRVRASVGGLVPRVKKVLENGRTVGKVVSVLWDDLALTITPMNPTVEPAVSLAKSLTSLEFVKALSAGYGTDSAAFSGGRALQKEDVGREKNLVSENVVAALVGAIADGDVTGLEEAESFLADYGVSDADSRDIVRAVVKKSNLFMEVFPMAEEKNKLWQTIIADLKKSLGGKKDEDDAEGESDDETEEDGDYEDGTPVLKALAAKVNDLGESIETMAKASTAMLERLERFEGMQKSLGEGVVAIMERTEEVLASPAPRKSAVSQLEAALAKSFGGGAAVPPAGGDAGTGGTLKPFTPESIDRAKDVLTKAVSDGKIDIRTCGKYETQMNKSVGKSFYPFTADFVDFMRKSEA